MIQRRAKLSLAYRKRAEANILTALVNLELYQRAQMIFCYVGMTDEIDTRLFIQKFLSQGKRVCVPKVLSLGEMAAFEITDLTDLALSSGKYQILEPVDGCPVVEKHEIDLGIIPCITADEQGFRLGYGGGFYDRYLTDSQMSKVLCLWSQMVVSDVPRESHDVPVDWLITENEVKKIIHR
ncbi:5-formyltetrahydrofolate cyclo-ligase [Vagococcus elongatus]|uniref:5-formyltetrahydrofolate cyclo-ligase n=2 Tax=Vagococcus elongatus TaxID=180344 RepID=A0A430AX72_9ENTE|nr:5-formyltetrahydrofolate cyclo-ligase [Vagococcus elongatus]